MVTKLEAVSIEEKRIKSPALGTVTLSTSELVIEVKNSLDRKVFKYYFINEIVSLSILSLFFGVVVSNELARAA